MGLRFFSSVENFGKTPITCCGVLRRLAFCSSSSLTQSTSVSAGGRFSRSQASQATTNRGEATRISSRTTFGPSATKSPSAVRFFFSSSEWMNLIFALLIIFFEGKVSILIRQASPFLIFYVLPLSSLPSSLPLLIVDRDSV